MRGALRPGRGIDAQARADRRLRILQLRHQGLTFRAIGAELGITGQRVHEVCKRVLQERQDSARALALERAALEQRRLRRGAARGG